MVLDQLEQLEALLGRAQRDVLLLMGVTYGERARVALAVALNGGDERLARQEAHRLRGAVAPFGAEPLVEVLQRLETTGGVDAAEIDARLSAFIGACAAALAA